MGHDPQDGGGPPPLTLKPVPVATHLQASLHDHNNKFTAYAINWILKHHSSGKAAWRVLILTERLLWQVDKEGLVTRLIPLDRLKHIEYDRRLNRARLACDDTTQDWLFEFMPHQDNQPDGPDGLFAAISACRKRLAKTEGQELPVSEALEHVYPDVGKKSGMVTASDRMVEYRRDPRSLPQLAGGRKGSSDNGAPAARHRDHPLPRHGSSASMLNVTHPQIPHASFGGRPLDKRAHATPPYDPRTREDREEDRLPPHPSFPSSFDLGEKRSGSREGRPPRRRMLADGSCVYTLRLSDPKESIGIGFGEEDESLVEEREAGSDKKAKKLARRHPLMVGDVLSDSPADHARLPRGRVLSVAGSPVHCLQDALTALEDMKALRMTEFELHLIPTDPTDDDSWPSLSPTPSATGSATAAANAAAPPFILPPRRTARSTNGASVPVDPELADDAGDGPSKGFGGGGGSSGALLRQATKALLISVRYGEHGGLTLEGGGERLRVMSRMLQRRGYARQRFLCERDEDVAFTHPRPPTVAAVGEPTRAAILEACRWLAAGARRGDCLFLYVSAHGSSAPTTRVDAETLEGAAVLPGDFAAGGVVVTREELTDQLLAPVVGQGATLTILSDMFNGCELVHMPHGVRVDPGGAVVREADDEDLATAYSRAGDGRVIALSTSAVEPGVATLPRVGQTTNAFLRAATSTASSADDPSFLALAQEMQAALPARSSRSKQLRVLLEYSQSRMDPDAVGLAGGSGVVAGSAAGSGSAAGLGGGRVQRMGSAPGELMSRASSGLTQRSLGGQKPSTNSAYAGGAAGRGGRRGGGGGGDPLLGVGGSFAEGDGSEEARLSRLVRDAGSHPTPPWLTGEHSGVDLLHTSLPARPHPDVAPVIPARERQRLISFYRYYNPERLPMVTSMIIQYKGEHDKLFAELVAKYGPEPHHIADVLPAGWSKVVSPKGEVFYRHEDGRRQWEPPTAGSDVGSEMLPPSPGHRPRRDTLDSAGKKNGRSTR